MQKIFVIAYRDGNTLEVVETTHVEKESFYLASRTEWMVREVAEEYAGDLARENGLSVYGKYFNHDFLD